jgi:hypothetical protein
MTQKVVDNKPRNACLSDFLTPREAEEKPSFPLRSFSTTVAGPSVRTTRIAKKTHFISPPSRDRIIVFSGPTPTIHIYDYDYDCYYTYYKTNNNDNESLQAIGTDCLIKLLGQNVE